MNTVNYNIIMYSELKTSEILNEWAIWENMRSTSNYEENEMK